MQQYYRDLEIAVQAGYEAGQMNKSIHEARAYIAKYVGE